MRKNQRPEPESEKGSNKNEITIAKVRGQLNVDFFRSVVSEYSDIVQKIIHIESEEEREAVIRDMTENKISDNDRRDKVRGAFLSINGKIGNLQQSNKHD